MNQTKIFKKYFISFIVLIILGTTLSFYFFKDFKKIQFEIVTSDFELQADERIQSFERSLRDCISVVKSLSSFFESSNEVNRGEFKKFSKSILEYSIPLKSLQWVPRVEPGNIEAFRKRAQNYGIEFKVKPWSDDYKNMGKKIVKSEVYPVFFYEPFKGNENALGYDMSSNDVYLGLLNRARETEEIISSQKNISLEEGSRHSFILLKAVFTNNFENSDNGKRNILRGYVLCEIGLKEIFETEMKRLDKNHINFILFDTNLSSDKQFMYCSKGVDIKNNQETKSFKKNNLFFKKKIKLGDRTLEILAYKEKNVVFSDIDMKGYRILFFGLGFTSLVIFLFLFVIIKNEKAQKLEFKAIKEKELGLQYLNIANMLIIALDLDGNVKLINNKGCELLEYDEKEIVGKNWFDNFIPERIRDDVKEVGEKIFKGEMELVKFYENPILTKSGRELQIAWHNSYLSSDDGKIIGLLTSGEDVTEKNISKNKIIKQKEFLQVIIESLPYPFYVIDIKTFKILIANKAAYSERQWEGETCYALTHHSDRPCYENGENCPLYSVKETKLPVMVEHIHFDKDGNDRIFEVHGYPIFNEQREVVQCIEYSIDVTQQRKAKAEMERLEDQLRQVQKMEALGTLAGGIAHDFNNILSPIIGYSELCEELFEEKSKGRDYIMQIIRAANRSKEIVEQILTFSRTSKKEKIEVNIKSIIKEALSLLRSSLPSTIEINTEIDEEYPFVLADQTHIHQIIMNLCANSFHAMKEVGGTLTIRLNNVIVTQDDFLYTEFLRSGKYLLLEIEDNGCGMQKKVLDRIFDPYFTTKTKGEGTGLGLSVVHGIVNDIGGHIYAYSEPGKGTKFKIYFSVVETKNNKDAIISKSKIPKGKGNILIVDDEKSIVDFSEKMLKKLGYDVFPFYDSLEALRFFEAEYEKVDLIITDQTMPNMTGVTFIQKVRLIKKSLPVIISTGFSDAVNQKLLEELNLEAIINKPFSMAEIAKAINKAIGKA